MINSSKGGGFLHLNTPKSIAYSSGEVLSASEALGARPASRASIVTLPFHPQNLWRDAVAHFCEHVVKPLAGDEEDIELPKLTAPPPAVSLDAPQQSKLATAAKVTEGPSSSSSSVPGSTTASSSAAAGIDIVSHHFVSGPCVFRYQDFDGALSMGSTPQIVSEEEPAGGMGVGDHAAAGTYSTGAAGASSQSKKKRGPMAKYYVDPSQKRKTTTGDDDDSPSSRSRKTEQEKEEEEKAGEEGVMTVAEFEAYERLLQQWRSLSRSRSAQGQGFRKAAGSTTVDGHGDAVRQTSGKTSLPLGKRPRGDEPDRHDVRTTTFSTEPSSSSSSSRRGDTNRVEKEGFDTNNRIVDVFDDLIANELRAAEELLKSLHR